MNIYLNQRFLGKNNSQISNHADEDQTARSVHSDPNPIPKVMLIALRI